MNFVLFVLFFFPLWWFFPKSKTLHKGFLKQRKKLIPKAFSEIIIEWKRRKQPLSIRSRTEKLREVYGHILFVNELKCHLNRVLQQKQQVYWLIIFYSTAADMLFLSADEIDNFPASTSSLYITDGICSFVHRWFYFNAVVPINYCFSFDYSTSNNQEKNTNFWKLEAIID